MTGGMDNPVEVAITPEGERFFTSTFLQHPGNGLRDGIAHAIYGGVYGKPHNVIDGHIRTGGLMPIMTQLGPAAPSGLICLESNQLVPPSEPEQRTLVAALFNLQKVTAHHLQPVGASFTTTNQDLLVADRIDFHPTDILEDADGSLLIIDTGGWYDLCCPTSRIDQKTASGGVYRLSRKGSEKQLTPKPTSDDPVANLHDERPMGSSTCIASDRERNRQSSCEVDKFSIVTSDQPIGRTFLPTRFALGSVCKWIRACTFEPCTSCCIGECFFGSCGLSRNLTASL